MLAALVSPPCPVARPPTSMSWGAQKPAAQASQAADGPGSVGSVPWRSPRSGHRGRYKLVNGLVIAKDWASLTSGDLLNTITADEYSQVQDSRVWTGTLADGQPALGSEFCGDWDD